MSPLICRCSIPRARPAPEGFGGHGDAVETAFSDALTVHQKGQERVRAGCQPAPGGQSFLWVCHRGEDRQRHLGGETCCQETGEGITPYRDRDGGLSLAMEAAGRVREEAALREQANAAKCSKVRSVFAASHVMRTLNSAGIVRHDSTLAQKREALSPLRCCPLPVEARHLAPNLLPGLAKRRAGICPEPARDRAASEPILPRLFRTDAVIVPLTVDKSRPDGDFTSRRI